MPLPKCAECAPLATTKKYEQHEYLLFSYSFECPLIPFWCLCWQRASESQKKPPQIGARFSVRKTPRATRIGRDDVAHRYLDGFLCLAVGNELVRKLFQHPESWERKAIQLHKKTASGSIADILFFRVGSVCHRQLDRLW